LQRIFWFQRVVTSNFLFSLRINRYAPSKADLSVFDALGKAPAATYANIARWYRNIASYSSAERSAWSGSAVPQVAGGKPTVAADDDDVDLFGSDEEDDEEAERIKVKMINKCELGKFLMISPFSGRARQGVLRKEVQETSTHCQVFHPPRRQALG
jgi:hypothetical protein